MKIATVLGHDLDAFIGPVESILAREHEVRRFVCKTGPDVEAAFAWADGVFLEWANETAEYATRSKAIRELPRRWTVVRGHSYEMFPQAAGVPSLAQKLDWSRVDRLVYVAEHCLDGLRATTPVLPPTVFLPSAIDLTKFPKQEHHAGFRIGLAANVRPNKGLESAVQILMNLHERGEDRHELAIAGAVEDGRLAAYVRWAADKYDLKIRFDGHVKDMAAWWRDRDFNLSCSYWEGCPYGVLESMALGVRPVIHEYPGAAAQFPADCLWSTIDRAADRLDAQTQSGARAPDRWYRSDEWRAWVEERNNIEKQAATILGLFERGAT